VDGSKIKAESPLAQGRGLKRLNDLEIRPRQRVAPRAGAWIETLYPPWAAHREAVAPRAGVNYTVNSGHLIPDISLMLSPDFGSLKIEGLLAFDNQQIS